MYNTSNALYILVLWKQMSLKQTSETGSGHEIITQRVPGRQASNSECPTAIHAETALWHNQAMSSRQAGRPATANVQRPYMLRLRCGTTRRWRLVEQRCRQLATSEMGIWNWFPDILGNWTKWQELYASVIMCMSQCTIIVVQCLNAVDVLIRLASSL